MVADALVDGLARRLFGPGWRQQVQPLASVERHTTVLGADRPAPDPHHFAPGAQLVEHARLVAADSRGQDVALVDRPGQEQPLELSDHFEYALEAARLAADVVPAGQEAAQRGGGHRLDLASEPRKRAAAHRA